MWALIPMWALILVLELGNNVYCSKIWKASGKRLVRTRLLPSARLQGCRSHNAGHGDGIVDHGPVEDALAYAFQSGIHTVASGPRSRGTGYYQDEGEGERLLGLASWAVDSG